MPLNQNTTPSSAGWCPTEALLNGQPGYIRIDSVHQGDQDKRKGVYHINAVDQVTQFAFIVTTRYINFHRPCYFPTKITDNKGKERKQYRYEDRMTPYEKLRSLPQAGQYLKPSTTLDELDAFAREMTDNEAAEQVNLTRDKLFTQFYEQLQHKASCRKSNFRSSTGYEPRRRPKGSASLLPFGNPIGFVPAVSGGELRFNRLPSGAFLDWKIRCFAK